jgi:hypothetical protein
VLGEVLLNERIKEPAFLGVEGLLLDEEVAERFRLVEDPRLHAGEELLLRDEVALQGDHSEDEIQVGRGSHDGLRAETPTAGTLDASEILQSGSHSNDRGLSVSPGGTRAERGTWNGPVRCTRS